MDQFHYDHHWQMEEVRAQDRHDLAMAQLKEYHARRMELLQWEHEERVRLYGDALMRQVYPGQP